MSGLLPFKLIEEPYTLPKKYQPYSRDIFNKNSAPRQADYSTRRYTGLQGNQKGKYLLNDFLNHGNVRHQIQLRNNGDLRIPLYATTQFSTCCSLQSHPFLE